jgi:hypothetical protein
MAFARATCIENANPNFLGLRYFSKSKIDDFPGDGDWGGTADLHEGPWQRQQDKQEGTSRLLCQSISSRQQPIPNFG